MADPTKWTPATVVHRHEWEDGLWTFRLDIAPSFVPGQFAMLGLELDADDHVTKRAYSIASAPDAPLELFVVRVDEGELTPHLWRKQVGDTVLLWHKITGHFTVEKSAHGDVLWLVGTGTGVAPYVSMLREGSVFDRFSRVVLVQGARTASQLGYRAELEDLASRRPLTYLPALTREDAPGALRGRIPDLLVSGALEAAAGVTATPDGHFIMLCGNPDMVKAMLDAYKLRDMFLLTPKHPTGNVHIEKYW